MELVMEQSTYSWVSGESLFVLWQTAAFKKNWTDGWMEEKLRIKNGLVSNYYVHTFKNEPQVPDWPALIMAHSSKLTNPTLRNDQTLAMCERTSVLEQHMQNRESKMCLCRKKYIYSDDHILAAFTVITVRIRDQQKKNSRVQGNSGSITALMMCTICEKTNEHTQSILPFLPTVSL